MRIFAALQASGGKMDASDGIEQDLANMAASREGIRRNKKL
jgi:hypothetical protein